MNKADNTHRLAEGNCSNRTLIKCILIYTPIYIIMAVLAYYLFISEGKTLIRYIGIDDPFAQRYVFVFEFKRFLQTLFGGTGINTWDWSVGLGADGYIFNSATLYLPSSYVLALTPEKYVDVVYSLITVFRIYLSGIAFMLFARKCGLNSFQMIFGAVMYSFCPWAFATTLIQGTFLKATIFFPLIILGEEKLIRHESPLLFIASVGYTVLTFFSFAYMMAIVVLIYYIVRMLTLAGPGRIDDIIKTSILFVLSGLSGIMTAGIGFIVTINKLSETTATTAKTTTLLWTLKDYILLPLRLMEWNSVFGSSSVIGIAAIGVILAPLIIYRAWKRDTNAVMAVLLSVLILFPLACRMFNFFSYPSGRWIFMPAFFVSLAAASCIDGKLLRPWHSKMIMTVIFELYIFYSLLLYRTLDHWFRVMLAVSLATGTICVLIIWLFYRGERAGNNAGAATRRAGDDSISAGAVICRNRVAAEKFGASLLLAVTCLGIVVNCNLDALTEIEYFPRVGQPLEILYQSEERAGQKIEDDEFYRVSQAKVNNVNRQIFFGNRSNYVFYSYIDTAWIRYNQLLGNSLSSAYRVNMRGNDGRFGLEFLQGTRYFLGDHDGEKGLDNFASYGYEPYEKIDGVNVLRNQYFIGLGCVYDSYIRESEWEKLSYADREVAMLMAAVVPDDFKIQSSSDDAGAAGEMTEIKAPDIDSGVRLIPYTIKANKRRTKYTINAENDADHQLLMTIENARAAGEAIYRIKVINDNFRKKVTNSRGKERGYADISAFTVNLGSGKSAGSPVDLILWADKEAMAGGLDFDDIKIYSIPLKTYDKYAKALMGRRFEVEEFDNDYIKGRITTDRAGILYLSIFDDLGWDIYIDGEKARSMDQINIAFTGAEISAGDHEIELKYHTRYFWCGVIFTLAGILLAAAVYIAWRKITPDCSSR